jgi:biopolymer transport protein ExbD
MQPVKAANVRSDINVTPLVDVMLVLLIIFMVVTPMLQKGPAVKLPLTNNPPKKPEDQKQLLVAISHDRRMWLEKDQISEAQFEAAIREAYERNPGSSVVIKGDARLSYGDVKRAVLTVKDAGFTQVGLIVEKRDTGATEGS